jgi:chromosomal replication initiation ATPase DnaA
MTVSHPKIRKIIQDTQDQVRTLTGNDLIYISIVNHEKMKIEWSVLTEVICGVTGISFERACIKTRKTLIVRTRQLISYYAYECGDMNYCQIADKFDQDHTTALQACVTIKNMIDTGDQLVCDFVRKINNVLGLTVDMKKEETITEDDPDKYHRAI